MVRLAPALPCLLLAACASGAPPCAGVPGAPALDARLFLGGNVAAADWQGFLETEVTPRFPDGLTVLSADGQWRAPGGSRTIREHSRLLVIVMPRDAAAIAAVEAVADAYRHRFAQQSVGVVFTDACAAF